jgi:hypothetical protein
MDNWSLFKLHEPLLADLKQAGAFSWAMYMLVFQFVFSVNLNSTNSRDVEQAKRYVYVDLEPQAKLDHIENEHSCIVVMSVDRSPVWAYTYTYHTYGCKALQLGHTAGGCTLSCTYR